MSTAHTRSTSLPMFWKSSLLILSLSLFLSANVSVAQATETGARMIEDFQSYRAGDIPHEWKFLRNRRIIPLKPEHFNDREKFTIVEEGRRRFVRARSEERRVGKECRGRGLREDENDSICLSIVILDLSSL